MTVIEHRTSVCNRLSTAGFSKLAARVMTESHPDMLSYYADGLRCGNGELADELRGYAVELHRARERGDFARRY